MKFKCIENTGNLISDDILINLSEKNSKHKYALPESYRWHYFDHEQRKEEFDKTIEMIWTQLYTLWGSVCLQFDKMSNEEYFSKWTSPMLTLLGYKIQKINYSTEVYTKNVKISHKSHDLQKPWLINIFSYRQDLEKKSDLTSYTPHDGMQKLLNYLANNSDNQFIHWGLITNGQHIRILRKYHHQTRKAYIQFNLNEICDSRQFYEFKILYSLIHPSRFLICSEKNELRIENLFKESISAGVKIGEELRENVITAIECLGNGFIKQNDSLHQKISESFTELETFHHNLLRVVYRVLFLLFAEQRQLMRNAHEIYHKEYSITALRNKYEYIQYISEDNFSDIWKGLLTTFSMVETGVKDLNISCFNGELFNPLQIESLLKLECPNSTMIQFIRLLTIVERKENVQRISYTELGVEEIGSIYESLLDYSPQFNISNEELIIQDKIVKPDTFFLDPRGKSRKTSGSYYTHQSLVNALIESALEPLVSQKIETAKDDKNKQIANILSLRICDPACGSGAFLIATTEYLGKKLALINSETDDINEYDLRYFRREALRHCIYGVDLNPLSVELAKISLWLTAFSEDKPLNFLDHHIKCGNSLIGVFPGMDFSFIPAEAFNTDNESLKSISNLLKKRAEKIRKDVKIQTDIFSYGAEKADDEYKKLVNFQIESENSSEEVNQLRIHFEELKNSNWQKMKEYLYNYFVSSFYSLAFLENSIDPHNYKLIKSYSNIELLQKDTDLYNDRINQFAMNNYFFHWELEFPEVFDNNINSNPGFDCVLGNPPWERIKLQEKEFFDTLDINIANAKNKSLREKLIKQLPQTHPELYNMFISAKNKSFCDSSFLRNSTRYKLTAQGDINTYPLFAELFFQLLNQNGRSGIIVPTGIATDDSNKNYFSFLTQNKHLVSLFDFENRMKLFSDVDSRFKFSLLTISKDNVEQTNFAFFLQETDHLNDKQRRFTLSNNDLKAINPNTCTTPIFRTKFDAELTKKIYSKVPILHKESDCMNDLQLEKYDLNPWGITFLRMFDMSNDSNLFKTTKSKSTLPLFEAKMIWHYDHRFGSYANVAEDSVDTHLPTPELSAYQNPEYTITPRYWVDELEVYKKLVPLEKEEKELLESQTYEEQLEYLKPLAPKYLFGFRNISNNTNERSFIGSIIPIVGLGNSMPLLVSFNINRYLLFSNFSSIVLDYFVRQKLGGTNLNFHYVKQFPVLAPEDYTEMDIEYIKERVLELTYTAIDLKGFAKELGFDGEPFVWEEERRFKLKAELDAYYAHLYGLTEEELTYILDPSIVFGSDYPGETFRVLKDKENKQYGYYKTLKYVIDAFRIIKQKV